MTSFSIMAPKTFFVYILSTLARYNASEFHFNKRTGIYFILYPITYQNIKIKLKKNFRSDETALQSYIHFFPIFPLWDNVTM